MTKIINEEASEMHGMAFQEVDYGAGDCNTADENTSHNTPQFDDINILTLLFGVILVLAVISGSCAVGSLSGLLTCMTFILAVDNKTRIIAFVVKYYQAVRNYMRELVDASRAFIEAEYPSVRDEAKQGVVSTHKFVRSETPRVRQTLLVVAVWLHRMAEQFENIALRLDEAHDASVTRSATGPPELPGNVRNEELGYESEDYSDWATEHTPDESTTDDVDEAPGEQLHREEDYYDFSKSSDSDDAGSLSSGYYPSDDSQDVAGSEHEDSNDEASQISVEDLAVRAFERVIEWRRAASRGELCSKTCAGHGFDKCELVWEHSFTWNGGSDDVVNTSEPEMTEAEKAARAEESERIAEEVAKHWRSKRMIEEVLANDLPGCIRSGRYKEVELDQDLFDEADFGSFTTSKKGQQELNTWGNLEIGSEQCNKLSPIAVAPLDETVATLPSVRHMYGGRDIHDLALRAIAPDFKENEPMSQGELNSWNTTETGFERFGTTSSMFNAYNEVLEPRIHDPMLRNLTRAFGLNDPMSQEELNSWSTTEIGSEQYDRLFPGSFTALRYGDDDFFPDSLSPEAEVGGCWNGWCEDVECQGCYSQGPHSVHDFVNGACVMDSPMDIGPGCANYIYTGAGYQYGPEPNQLSCPPSDTDEVKVARTSEAKGKAAQRPLNGISILEDKGTSTQRPDQSPPPHSNTRCPRHHPTAADFDRLEEFTRLCEDPELGEAEREHFTFMKDLQQEMIGNDIRLVPTPATCTNLACVLSGSGAVKHTSEDCPKASVKRSQNAREEPVCPCGYCQIYPTECKCK